MNRRDFLKTSAAALGVASILPASTAIASPEPKQIFTTGLPSLDRLMNGGIRRGELALGLAPGVGMHGAFCRTMRKANFPNHTGNMTVRKGDNDLLFLSPTYSLMMTNTNVGHVDYETAENEWMKYYNTSRFIKDHALQTGDAVIWSFPAINYVRARDDIGGSYHYMLPADYVILLTRKRKQVILYKNRHGEKGAVDIEFYYENGEAMIKEKV